MNRRAAQILVVKTLNRMCTWVDAIAYRPAAVKLTERLPRWWSCQLARASMKLDDRWGTGYWSSEDAPAAPEGTCDACKRRAAWLAVGGLSDGESEPTYLDLHPVDLCGWCKLEIASPPRNQIELDRILADARARSVAWPWRR